MLVPAEVWTVAKWTITKTDHGSAVFIRAIGSNMAVPIFIGQSEAHSIMIGLANHIMPRPLTHDLILSVLKKLNSTISRIEITDLKDGTFYGRLILSCGGEETTIDSRPSDCIAIAVRTKCPIYIDESVVDEAGVSVDIIGNALETPPVNKEDQIQILKDKLNMVVEDENYEEAARLRDEINKLENNL